MSEVVNQPVMNCDISPAGTPRQVASAHSDGVAHGELSAIFFGDKGFQLALNGAMELQKVS